MLSNDDLFLELCEYGLKMKKHGDDTYLAVLMDKPEITAIGYSISDTCERIIEAYRSKKHG
jgi:hypothetical protein